jgi:hypothetical protein
MRKSRRRDQDKTSLLRPVIPYIYREGAEEGMKCDATIVCGLVGRDADAL